MPTAPAADPAADAAGRLAVASLSDAPPAAAAKKKAKRRPPPLPTVTAAASWLPWTLQFTARLGRHAVAARDLPAGTLVLHESAVAAVPRARHARRACRACAGPLEGEVPAVPGAGGPYCSAACEARHAPIAALAAAGRAAAPAIAAACPGPLVGGGGGWWVGSGVI